MKQLLMLILAALLGAAMAIFIERTFLPRPFQQVVIQQTPEVRYTNLDEVANRTARSVTRNAPSDFVAVAESVTAAVVHVKSEGEADFDFWSSGEAELSSGSGVIISPDGYIVTNKHVLAGGTDIRVTLNNRHELEAAVVGSDPSTDLALLKIEARKLPYIQFGNSDSLRIGEWVLAVGSPFNLHSTVTTGIVSAKGRDINILEARNAIESFIQTDAMVNPGNSGGALVNTKGELIGINTAIMTSSGNFEGYSFAIPSNIVRKISKDLRNFGTVKRGILGVDIKEVSDKTAKRLGLASVEGVLVERVHEGSNAAKAGLQRNDVIVAANGIAVKSMPQLQAQIALLRPKDKVILNYIRKGKFKSMTIYLGDSTLKKEIVEEDIDVLKKLGFQLSDLTPDEKRRLSVEGVKVAKIVEYGIIAETNMDKHFVITMINDIPISSVDAAISLLSASSEITLEGFYEAYTGKYIYTFSY